MRPFKVFAVVFSSLIVTGYLIYAGNFPILNKPVCYHEKDVDNNNNDDDDDDKLLLENHIELEDLKDSESIYMALQNLLGRQSMLNTKDSLSRNDFDTVVTLSLLLPPIHNISRMLTPSPQTFRNYIAPSGLPIIFTDMLEGTTLDNWSWDLVREKWGNEVFHNTRQGNYSTQVTKFGKHKVNRVSIKLSDFIDVVTERRKPNDHEKGLYITKQKMLPTEALEKEFYYPPFYSGEHKKCFLEPTGW